MSKCVVPVLLLAIGLPNSVSAAVFEIRGQVATATGAFSVLTPVGTLIEGSVAFDDAAVSAGHAGEADLEFLDINLGGFCFTTGNDNSGCPNGGAFAPVYDFYTVSVYFVSGLPADTNLDIRIGSATFEHFDISFADGMFTADAGPIGGVAGPAAWVVPLPAAVWLYASGVVALMRVSTRTRKRKWVSHCRKLPNKALQQTLDPVTSWAVAKEAPASSAAELGR